MVRATIRHRPPLRQDFSVSSDFTFYHALIGGALIGLASVFAVFATGEIPGISGMFSRVLGARAGDTAWRVVFFLGLFVGAGVAYAVVRSTTDYHPVRSTAVILTAGLLVGFGTRVGGGCTSGHGVCGIGFGSRTAIVATLVYVGMAMLTVWAVYHGGLIRYFP
jgi:uncharacterized protein